MLVKVHACRISDCPDHHFSICITHAAPVSPHEVLETSDGGQKHIFPIIVKEVQQAIKDLIYLVHISLGLSRILGPWFRPILLFIGDYYDILSWFVTTCHHVRDVLELRPDGVHTGMCTLQKLGSEWNFPTKTPPFKGFGPAHAPLIFANLIATFVEPTNENAGFSINVWFLSKVGGACQQDQRLSLIFNLYGLLHVQFQGRKLVENFKLVNYDVTMLPTLKWDKQQKIWWIKHCFMNKTTQTVQGYQTMYLQLILLKWGHCQH